MISAKHDAASARCEKNSQFVSSPDQLFTVGPVGTGNIMPLFPNAENPPMLTMRNEKKNACNPCRK